MRRDSCDDSRDKGGENRDSVTIALLCTAGRQPRELLMCLYVDFCRRNSHNPATSTASSTSAWVSVPASVLDWILIIRGVAHIGGITILVIA